MPPVPKPNKHKRKVPTQGQRGKFTPQTIQAIYSRSGGICEYCHSKKATDIHHVVSKARFGRNNFTNGIHICRDCHNQAHKNEEVMQDMIRIYEQKYGKNFYKDEWDLQAEKQKIQQQ